ncbi:MAG TPA: TIM barrel protein [Blastocatellia bacterium]|nr:TIM barrel protein [Blastocatellia bacterium]
MGIKIATAPVSWGIFEVEGFGTNKTYSQVLDEMAEAGYSGTELGPYGFLPTSPDRLQAELSVRGLHLVSAFVPIPLSEPSACERAEREVEKVADLLRACGATLIVLADAMTPERMAIAGRVFQEPHGLTEDQWRAAADMIMRMARTCAARGLRTAFHHHAGTYVETPEEIERLLALTDPADVGLCLDTGHYVYGGGDPVDAVRRFGRRIWHLHLKDVRAPVLDAVRRERLGFLEAVGRGVFCELGEGAVNIRAVVTALQEANYDGWAVVEQDVDIRQPGVNPLASARRSRAYLREVIGL